MKKTIKNLYTHFVAFRYLLYLEKGHNQYVPLIKRIKYLSKGFSSDKIDLYNLKANNYKNYLPDYHRRKTFQINGQYARSEERRVGKESKWRWWRERQEKRGMKQK